MIGEILKVIGFMLIASVKFLYAPAAVYAADYGFLTSVLITSGGGFMGVFFFFMGGQFVTRWWIERFPSSKPRKNFTKGRRRMIRIKSSYGMFGLAFITPCIISIPFGSIIAARYYRNDPWMLPLLFTSVVFWSLVLSGITFLVGPIFE